MFIEKLTTRQMLDLLKEMRISPIEDTNYPTSYYNGKLRICHGKTKDNRKIESIYTDFRIIKLYNSDPSKYDQRKYHNYMTHTLGKEYADALEEDNKKYLSDSSEIN